jgi:hypothetical protein
MGDAVEKRSPSGGQVIDLLDIARPAKPKGEGDFFDFGIGHQFTSI